MKSAHFDKFCAGIAGFAAFLFLFGPFLLVDQYQSPPLYDAFGTPNIGQEVAVGLAVITRATARRLFTAAAHNVVRTTMGTFSRATARTFIRRLIRFTVRTLFGVLAIDTLLYGAMGITAIKRPRHPVVAVGLGTIVLSLSFLGILHVVEPWLANAVTTSSPLSYLTCSLLAGLPLTVYALIHAIVAPRLNVRLQFNTAIDGLILQAYFTGAGSFLPMTTDIEYIGNSRNNMRVAAISLATMFVIYLVLTWIGYWADMTILRFAADMFLLYCFVYVFPIRPLEGYNIWCESKAIWLAIFLAILIAFFKMSSEAFTAIV